MKRFIRIISLILVLFVLLPFCALGENGITILAADFPVERDGKYSSVEEVSVYLATFKQLPSNYITKDEARKLGWNTKKGVLWKVTDHGSIGGDRFGNYEGTLPKGQWTECDIDYDGKTRNGKRIVFNEDCSMIYYTYDHYNTFVPVTVDFTNTEGEPVSINEPIQVEEDGRYDTLMEVAEYIHQFGHLPSNYITKAEAKELGWKSKENNLEAVAPGCYIGGDRFYNREGLLPDKEGRKWYECDLHSRSGKQRKERLVYSSDGLIYYTSDGYKSFDQIY